MTRQETVKLLAYITACYPAWELTEATVEVWHEMLEDLEFPVALAALKRVIAVQPRVPTIAEIRREAARLLQPDLVEPEAAWAMVAEAVDKYGYYAECQALDSLPGPVARAARAIGWEQICLGDPGVVRTHFMRVYQGLASREREEMLIPPSARALPEGQRKPELPAGTESIGAILSRLPGGGHVA